MSGDTTIAPPAGVLHVNMLRPLVPDGWAASQHRLLKAAQALGHLDNERVFVACEAEGCSASVPVAAAYSLALVYRMPGRGAPAFQCGEEQHFGCSHEHAVAAMLACLKLHIEPAHRAMRTVEAVPSVTVTEGDGG